MKAELKIVSGSQTGADRRRWILAKEESNVADITWLHQSHRCG